jgi:hypothetical protein
MKDILRAKEGQDVGERGSCSLSAHGGSAYRGCIYRFVLFENALHIPAFLPKNYDVSHASAMRHVRSLDSGDFSTKDYGIHSFAEYQNKSGGANLGCIVQQKRQHDPRRP